MRIKFSVVIFLIFVVHKNLEVVMNDIYAYREVVMCAA